MKLTIREAMRRLHKNLRTPGRCRQLAYSPTMHKGAFNQIALDLTTTELNKVIKLIDDEPEEAYQLLLQSGRKIK